MNFESYKETIDFKTDAAIKYYDYWFCTHACDGASESCRATTTVSPASMGYYPDRIVWDNTWGYLGHEAFLLFSTGMLYEDPALLRLQQKNAAANQRINLAYNKSMLEAAKDYTGSVIDAGRSAARASTEAAQAAADAEIQAADAYCTAVEEAALAANEALIQIALGADPTGEIVSYLIAMAELEIDAEIAKMEALGNYQLGSKQEFLETLSTTDSRYEAALADLRWTETTVEARNVYYASLGAATLQYQTSTYTAMNTYNNSAMRRDADRQIAVLRKQSEYATTRRLADRLYSTRQNEANAARELALIDAAFSEFRSNAEYEFQLAEQTYNNYSSVLSGLLGDDDSSYEDFGSLANSVNGIQSANYASIASFRAEQTAARQAATAAANDAHSNELVAADAFRAADMAGVNAGYLSEYYSGEAETLLEEMADYSAYVEALESAEQEYDAERYRLAGLLQDSIDTGVNMFPSNTGEFHAFAGANANGLPGNNINDKDILDAMNLDPSKSYRLVLAVRAIQGFWATGTSVRHGFLMIQVQDESGEWSNASSVSWHPDHWGISADESAPGRVWINDPRDRDLTYVEGYSRVKVQRFFIITSDRALIENFVKKLPAELKKQNVGVEIGEEISIDGKYGYGSGGHRNSNARSKYYNLTGYNCFNASHVLLEETGKSLPSKARSQLDASIQSTKDDFSSKYNVNPNVNVRPRVLTTKRQDMALPETYGVIPPDNH